MTERLEDVASAPRRPRSRDHDFGDDDFDGAGSGPELSLFIPERIARAFDRRRNSWTQVDQLASWLVAAHLLVLLVVVGRGSLYLDDLRAQAYALDQPFLRFILGSNGTHFAPVPRILDWTQAHWFPLQHAPAVIVTLVIRVLLAASFWRLLRRVFGPQPAILVPFAMLLFTPAMLPATTWYRQCITVVACAVAMVWAVDAMLRWVLYRRRADLASVVVSTVVGVCCYEKAAAIPVILAAVAAAVFVRRRGTAETAGPPSLVRPVRAAAIAVASSALVVVIFLIIYRSGPYDQGTKTSTPSPLDVLHLAWNTGTRTVVPLLFGGPYHWSYPSPYAGVAFISTTTMMFCLLLVGVGLVVAVRRGAERTARGVLVLLVWTIASVGIVALGRFDSFELLLAQAQRLWADLVPAFLLAGALAVLPWDIGVLRSAPRPGTGPDESLLEEEGSSSTIAVEGGQPRPTRASTRDQLRPARGGAPIEVTVPVIAGSLVTLLVLGGSALSTYTYAQKWWENPTGTWLSNARTSLEAAEPYARTLATPLPTAVMPAWVTTQLPTSAPLLMLMRPDIRFHDADGDAKVMNSAGVRVPYFPVVVTQTKKASLCLRSIPVGSQVPVTVKLPKTAQYVAGNQVEVGLLLGEATKVEVTVVTTGGKVLTPLRYSDDELPAGPHTVRFPAPFNQWITEVRVRTNAAATGCITYARVWAPLA